MSRSSAARVLNVGNELVIKNGPLASLFSSFIWPLPNANIYEIMEPIFEGIDTGRIDINRIELETVIAVSMDAVEELFRCGSIDESVMTRAMAATLFIYSAESTFYERLNLFLRSLDRSLLRPFALFLWIFEHALEQCPKFDGTTVYRGVKGKSNINIKSINLNVK